MIQHNEAINSADLETYSIRKGGGIYILEKRYNITVWKAVINCPGNLVINFLVTKVTYNIIIKFSVKVFVC